MDLANFQTMDSVMLMSIVNMKLRDEFDGNLDRLCARFDISKSALTDKLNSAGFEFFEQAKQFR